MATAAVGKVRRVYDSSDAATDGAAALAVQAAQQVYTHYAPVVTQGGWDAEAAGLAVSRAAEGVQLSEADTMLWRLLLLARIETAGRQAIGQVAPLAASGELQQDLQVGYAAVVSWAAAFWLVLVAGQLHSGVGSWAATFWCWQLGSYILVLAVGQLHSAHHLNST
jgi:hypothetical protein